MRPTSARTTIHLQDHGARAAMIVEHPDRIDLTVLSQFPELKKYRTGSGRGRRAKTPTLPALETASTPEERVEAAYQELQQALADEIQERIVVMSPAAFEDLVLDVLHAMGYGDEGEGARLRTGASGDAGID